MQYNNQINDKVLSEICGRCKNLRSLNISYCRHLGVFTPLSWLNNLREVFFAASTVTDEDIEPMIKHGNLETFHATSCSIGDSSLALLAEYCINLVELSLNHCDSISSENVNLLLHNCHNLKCISLQGSDVDRTIFDDIEISTSKSIGKLNVLDLSYCRRFDDSGILKLNDILHQRYLLGHIINQITVYVHQTKVTKAVCCLIEPNLLSVQM